MKSKSDKLADVFIGYIKKEQTSTTRKVIKFVIWAIALAGIAFFLYNKFHTTSELEKNIEVLEKEVKTQEKVITQKRQENDKRVQERVKETFQEYQDLTKDELDARWIEFMDGVRRRNYERENNINSTN